MPVKPDPKKILDEAMQLEPTTRAFVAETLLESLDLDQDFAVSRNGGKKSGAAARKSIAARQRCSTVPWSSMSCEKNTRDEAALAPGSQDRNRRSRCFLQKKNPASHSVFSITSKRRCTASTPSPSLPPGRGRDTQVSSSAFPLRRDLSGAIRFHRNHRYDAPAAIAGILDAKGPDTGPRQRGFLHPNLRPRLENQTAPALDFSAVETIRE